MNYPSVSGLRRSASLVGALLISLGFSSQPAAELRPEKLSAATVPAQPSPHWVWVNDIAFLNMIDGRAYLFDGDTGRMLGMVAGGNFHDALAIPKGYKEFYSTDTYYSRGTRGERTDVVTVHDPQTLSATAEIVIPPKQLLSVPTAVTMNLSDDDRFLMQYNFTPTQSVSVADVKARKFVTEIDTPGCAFVLPSGPRRFQMICGDGSLLTVTLDDTGNASGKTRSAQFFNPTEDLLNEDAVRLGNKWYFVSYKGRVFSFDGSGDGPAFDAPWSLTSTEEFEQGWRPGGYQLFAIHAATGRLYVAMHVGGPGSHKNPASEIWIFDMKSKRRVQRIELAAPAMSVEVTRDDKPLLFTVSLEHPGMEIYDALSGEHLRTVHDMGAATPTILQVP